MLLDLDPHSQYGPGSGTAKWMQIHADPDPQMTTLYEISPNRYITHLFYFFLSIWSGWGALLLHIQSNLILGRNKHPLSAPGSGCHDFQAFVNKATYTWVVLVYFTVLRIRDVYPIPDPNCLHPGSASKHLRYFNPKKCFPSSRKYDLGCLSRIRILTFYPSRIPDPGFKKAPDPGSRIRIRNTGISDKTISFINSQTWQLTRHIYTTDIKSCCGSQ